MATMPVIVVGADTPIGEAVVEALAPAAAEIRAFISDEGRVERLKAQGVKVALGDLSDSSHVEAAALHCFCAVLVIEAALDGRELAFASDAPTVWEGWVEAIRTAGVHRTIWVSTRSEHAGIRFSRPTAEVGIVVNTDIDTAAAAVSSLEEAATLPG